MTFKQAVTQFMSYGVRYSDYWELKFDWSCYKDCLARDNQITERQRTNWGNPCTPETFKRFMQKWFGKVRVL